MSSDGSLSYDGSPEGFHVGDAVTASGISAKQRKRHVKWLIAVRHCKAWREVSDVVEKERVSRRWRWSTTRTVLGTIMGAVPRAQMYRVRCRLPKDRGPAFKDYVRSVENGVMAEVSTLNQATPASPEVILKIVRECFRLGLVELGVYIIVMWACAARPEDTMKLQPPNVDVRPDGRCRARWVEGKGVVMRRQPYTVHTVIPTEFVERVRGFLFTRHGLPRLFNDATLRQQLTKMLKSVDPSYTLYSIRRGAAITLATAGTPLPTIMLFTGHTSAAMCLRYLSWGWFEGHAAAECATAALSLWCVPAASAAS